MNKIIKKTSKLKFLIVANWKDTPKSLKEARKNFSLIKKQKINTKKFVTILCPALLHLSDLKNNYRGSIFEFGAQNLSPDNQKIFTGEVSVDQLVDLGVKYSIVGHAERRGIGETNDVVAKKIRQSIDFGILPILCVGEKERDEEAEYLRFVEKQIVESLFLIKKKELDKIIIAYEPVWTIGQGKKSISPHEIHKMVIFIKKVLTQNFDKKIALNVPVLYGGSVDGDNALEILKEGEVRGLLIGRASANPHSFKEILKSIS